MLVGLNYNGYDGQIWLYYDGTIFYGVNNTTTFAMNSNGFGYMQNNPQHGLDINDDTIRLHTSRTPASATATGSKGEICWDSQHGNGYLSPTSLWRLTTDGKQSQDRFALDSNPSSSRGPCELLGNAGAMAKSSIFICSRPQSS
jgi:hypothetical protein